MKTKYNEDYTIEQSLAYIKENRTISTLCLKSIGMSFDQFLRLGQMSDKEQQIFYDRLVPYLEKKIKKH